MANIFGEGDPSDEGGSISGGQWVIIALLLIVGIAFVMVFVSYEVHWGFLRVSEPLHGVLEWIYQKTLNR